MQTVQALSPAGTSMRRRPHLLHAGAFRVWTGRAGEEPVGANGGGGPNPSPRHSDCCQQIPNLRILA